MSSVLSRAAGLLLVLCAACASSPRVAAPRFRASAPVAHAPEVRAIDVEHYALELELHPAARSLDARCRIRFRSLREGLDHVALDLEGLDVASVVDGEGRALAFERADGGLAIALAEDLDPGESAEVVVAYSGRPAKGLWFSADREGAPTQVFTQGECEDARWWFPCVDSPSERATSEIVVTMPRGWTAVAAGERVERVESGDSATERWRMSVPHPSYLLTLVAGELVAEHGTWDGTPLSFLAAPRYAEWIGAAFEPTDDVLGFFSEVTGRRYPYAKYSQACVENMPFGGMENISATTLIDSALTDARGVRDGGPEGLVAHEAAHQWFGDLLTCAEWSEIWLNEGFATYLAALWFERSRGADDFRARMRDIQDAYASKDVGQHRRPTVWSVYRDPMDLFFTGQTYEGGAARLHHLRFVLGDNAFFRGVRLYVGRNAGRGATTEDLRSAMEEASGKDLGWFFDQWFHERGYPEFRVDWRYDENRKRLLVAVDQVQDIADGTPAAFRTPVDIEVRDSRGRTRHRFEIAERRHLFDIPADEAPQWVRFDKLGWIPKAFDTVKQADEWLLIAAEDDDVNGRRDAVVALGNLASKAESPEAQERFVAALVERLAHDACAPVRRKAAEVLAASRSSSALAALREAGARDADAGVRAAALAALCGRGPDAELAAFAEEQYRAGYSWKTMGAAAALFASASEPEAAFAWLDHELAVESPHGELASLLIDALAALEHPGVLDRLRAAALDAGSPPRARAAAVRQLGRLGRGRLDVLSELAGLLGERDVRLRRAAIEALGDLEDPAVIHPLEEYYARAIIPAERRIIEEILTSGRVE